jgi:hypothetical protein
MTSVEEASDMAYSFLVPFHDASTPPYNKGSMTHLIPVGNDCVPSDQINWMHAYCHHHQACVGRLRETVS